MDLTFLNDIENVAIEIRKILGLEYELNNFDEIYTYSNPIFEKWAELIEDKFDISIIQKNCLASYYIKNNKQYKIYICTYRNKEERLLDLIKMFVEIIIDTEEYNNDLSDVVEPIARAVLIPKSIFNHSIILNSTGDGSNIYIERIAKQFNVSSGTIVFIGKELGLWI